MATTNDLDVRRARAETPGCAEVIHLNNAGAALPPAPVTETVINHLRTESLRGGYEAAREAEDRLAGVYDSVAKLINADRSDIALTDSATRAWQAIFYALPIRAGDKILTGRAEYASNAIAFLQIAARTGATVEVVDDDEHGQLDCADLRRRLDDRVALIALTHVPTQGGLVNPAEEVGKIARAAEVPFLLDACQSAGQLDLDVTKLNCDALSVTGRKFLRGPRGTGFCYAHPRLRAKVEPAMLDLHSASWVEPTRYEVHQSAQMFEAWERDVAATLGLGAAVDYALELGMPAIERRVAGLADELRARLSNLAGVRVRDSGARRCGIVTFTADDVPASAIRERLAAERINTTVSSARSARYDFAARELPDLVRASVHYYNTEEEIERLVRVLTDMRGR